MVANGVARRRSKRAATSQKHDKVAPRFLFPRFLTLWRPRQCADGDLRNGRILWREGPRQPRALAAMCPAAFLRGREAAVAAMACHATWPKGGEERGTWNLDLLGDERFLVRAFDPHPSNGIECIVWAAPRWPGMRPGCLGDESHFRRVLVSFRSYDVALENWRAGRIFPVALSGDGARYWRPTGISALGRAVEWLLHALSASHVRYLRRHEQPSPLARPGLEPSRHPSVSFLAPRQVATAHPLLGHGPCHPGMAYDTPVAEPYGQRAELWASRATAGNVRSRRPIPWRYQGPISAPRVREDRRVSPDIDKAIAVSQL